MYVCVCVCVCVYVKILMRLYMRDKNGETRMATVTVLLK